MAFINALWKSGGTVGGFEDHISGSAYTNKRHQLAALRPASRPGGLQRRHLAMYRLIMRAVNLVVGAALALACFVIGHQLSVVPTAHFVGQSTDTGCIAYALTRRAGWRCSALDPIAVDPIPSVAALIVAAAAIAWFRFGPARAAAFTFSFLAALALFGTLVMQIVPVLKDEATPSYAPIVITLTLLGLALAHLVRACRRTRHSEST